MCGGDPLNTICVQHRIFAYNMRRPCIKCSRIALANIAFVMCIIIMRLRHSMFAYGYQSICDIVHDYNIERSRMCWQSMYLHVAWTVCKHKSGNALVISRDYVNALHINLFPFRSIRLLRMLYLSWNGMRLSANGFGIMTGAQNVCAGMSIYKCVWGVCEVWGATMFNGLNSKHCSRIHYALFLWPKWICICRGNAYHDGFWFQIAIYRHIKWCGFPFVYTKSNIMLRLQTEMHVHTN